MKNKLADTPVRSDYCTLLVRFDLAYYCDHN